MLNIDSHIINYKRNALANFCQINNNNIYIYIYFSFQNKSNHFMFVKMKLKYNKNYYLKMKNALLLIRFKVWFTIICKLLKPLCTIKHASNFKHKMTVLNFIVFYSMK